MRKLYYETLLVGESKPGILAEGVPDLSRGNLSIEEPVAYASSSISD